MSLLISLALRLRKILLTAQIGDALFQTANFLPAALQPGVRGEQGLVLERLPHGLGKLGQHRFMGDHGQIHLQQVLATLSQVLDKVQRVEDRQEHVTLPEHIVEVELADLIAIVGDGHAVFSAGAGQFMMGTRFIHKAHTDGNVGIALVMQSVNTALPKERKPGHDKGDGIGNAGFSPAIAAGDHGRIAENQIRWPLVGLKAGNAHAGDLKLLDLFQISAPFCFFRPFPYAACCTCW